MKNKVHRRAGLSSCRTLALNRGRKVRRRSDRQRRPRSQDLTFGRWRLVEANPSRGNLPGSKDYQKRGLFCGLHRNHSDNRPLIPITPEIREFKTALAKVVAAGTKFKWIRVLMQTMASAFSAAPGGIEAVLFALGGGAVSAAASAWSETEQAGVNELFGACLQEHGRRFEEISRTVFEIVSRIDLENDAVRQRVESDEYQNLIRRAFRDRSTYENEEKRDYLRKLLTNAAYPGVVPDGLVKIFIDWTGRYNELHFRVLSILRSHPLSTRLGMWKLLEGEKVREDSAEADLYAVLIMDLSFGHVIQQEVQKDAYGNKFKKEPVRTPRGQASPYRTSRFDDVKRYELTELGARFVHYIMNEAVKKLT